MAQPIVIHHRGNVEGSPHPANSLAAVQASLAAGAACIEIDIVALADADYLVIHDLVLESETTQNGAVGDCTRERARTLRFRSHPTFPLALLSDVIAAFRQSDSAARLQLDFKNVHPFADDEPLQRLIALVAPLGERVIVTSGADDQLRRLRTLSPTLRLGFDPHRWLRRRMDAAPPPTSATAAYWQQQCDACIERVTALDSMYLHYGALLQWADEGFNWAAHLAAHQIGVAAWTVDVDRVDAATIRRLADMGVTYITTNTPLALKDVLAS